MTSRGGHVALRVGGAARALAFAAAWLAAGAFVACGETTGPILQEAPVTPVFAAGGDADADGGAAAVVDCGTCANGLLLTGETLTAEQGGATTGTANTDTCPGNQAVIGYQGFLTPPSVGLILVGGIQALCGDLSVTGPLPAQVSTTPGATLPIRGTSQQDPWTQTCPANQVVVGFVGNSGAALDQVAFVCAPWTAASSDAGDDVLAMGSTVTLTPAGGDGGTPYAEVACPPGQIARGTASRSGEWVDAFGLVCGTPALLSDAGLPDAL